MSDVPPYPPAPEPDPDDDDDKRIGTEDDDETGED